MHNHDDSLISLKGRTSEWLTVCPPCPIWLTLRRPLHKKLRMRWFFDVSKVKESSFSLTPSDFWWASLEGTNVSPSSFNFPVGQEKKTMFIHTDQPLTTSFYIKKYLFFAELAISQRWSAIFCATGAWGLSLKNMKKNFRFDIKTINNKL